jgi:light-regulated signal transduction histidine kinase (bacteriophytochrome)
MDRMRSSAVRMRDLIAAVLDYARMGVEVDAIQNTDMNEVFRDVVEDLEEKIKRSEATVTAAPLPKVYANPTQIRRVLQNLINNGIKFQATDKPSINVSAEAKEGEYIFSVQDNGIGISPQYADQIFQAFRRLHSTAQYPGNGIGLATCRKIIEGHGGRIWVKSEEGKGAVFHFTIPKPPS